MPAVLRRFRCHARRLALRGRKSAVRPPSPDAPGSTFGAHRSWQCPQTTQNPVFRRLEAFPRGPRFQHAAPGRSWSLGRLSFLRLRCRRGDLTRIKTPQAARLWRVRHRGAHRGHAGLAPRTRSFTTSASATAAHHWTAACRRCSSSPPCLGGQDGRRRCSASQHVHRRVRLADAEEKHLDLQPHVNRHAVDGAVTSSSAACSWRSPPILSRRASLKARTGHGEGLETRSSRTYDHLHTAEPLTSASSAVVLDPVRVLCIACASHARRLDAERIGACRKFTIFALLFLA